MLGTNRKLDYCGDIAAICRDLPGDTQRLLCERRAAPDFPGKDATLQWGCATACSARPEMDARQHG
uniref:Uncharacterized protein n=1 Tax=Pseudomonas phage PACT201 TaxID=3230130 RepID=A0AAU8GSD2_9VIRU